MATIGIFDSGVGGLTVQKAILDRLPTLDTVYLGDTARVPYGSKSPEVVTQYSLRNARFLVAREIELLVVACNTASAVALPALRAALAIPVLGVVEPGARVAARATRSGRVGVIGTASTIASGAYQRALRAARPDVQVTAAACPLFVPLAEEGWTDPDDEVVRAVARRYLAPFAAAAVDTLVLGCTHYPLLARTIGDVMGRDVVLVSSGDETAFEARTLLGGAGHARRPGSEPPRRVFVTSGDLATFRTLGARFLGPEVETVEAWEWS